MLAADFSIVGGLAELPLVVVANFSLEFFLFYFLYFFLFGICGGVDVFVCGFVSLSVIRFVCFVIFLCFFGGGCFCARQTVTVTLGVLPPLCAGFLFFCDLVVGGCGGVVCDV
ncbi:hypothetical protein RBI21_15505 [Klebsiella pneumoniae]|nr:hypothetical protein RBI21_15505 [Klebsiella pneumoniae]